LLHRSVAWAWHGYQRVTKWEHGDGKRARGETPVGRKGWMDDDALATDRCRIFVRLGTSAAPLYDVTRHGRGQLVIVVAWTLYHPANADHAGPASNVSLRMRDLAWWP